MRYIILFVTMLAIISGCAFTPIFHNTAESDLKNLSESLTNTRLEDLFRHHPTLRLLKSTGIGNGNMRHEFSYVAIEKEDSSQRPSYSNAIYLYERHTTYSINIFVDDSGVIYEVLEPVVANVEIVMTNEEYNRFNKTQPTRDKTRSLPYP